MDNVTTFWDVDSTFTVESLDYLAQRKLDPTTLQTFEGITQAGMNGDMPFKESLRRRIDVLLQKKVTRADVDEVARALPHVLYADRVQKWIRDHQDKAIAITGGFRQVLEPLLLEIGFHEQNIFANEFRFDGDKLVGYDDQHPLAGNGGKVEVARRIVSGRWLDRDQIVMIGDGNSDWKVWNEGYAAAFIHFLGIVNPEERAAVIAKAPLRAFHHLDTLQHLQEFQQQVS